MTFSYLLQIVNGMDGVEAVRVIKESCDDGSGEVEISITQMADCDIREELFYKLAENRMPIMNLHADTKSLEDIFLQLTEEEHNNDSDI